MERDSLLLIRSLHKVMLGRNSLIDMGCGSGAITLLASSNGLETISVDREPRALSLTRSNLLSNGLRSELFLSDLFQGIPKGFKGFADLITFNPPYLGKDRYSPGSRSELALSGGLKGWEISARFLSEAPFFLSRTGSILLISYPDWRMDDLDWGDLYSRCEIVEELDMDGEVLEAILLSP